MPFNCDNCRKESWTKKLSTFASAAISVLTLATGNIVVKRHRQYRKYDHFKASNVPGIRLVQAAYHNRSLCTLADVRIALAARSPDLLVRAERFKPNAAYGGAPEARA